MDVFILANTPFNRRPVNILLEDAFYKAQPLYHSSKGNLIEQRQPTQSDMNLRNRPLANGKIP